MTTLKEWAGVVALVAILLTWAIPSPTLVVGASGTRFPNGLSTDSTSPSSGQVRTTTFTATGLSTLAAATLSGVATFDAGTLHSSTNSTSTTATSQTLAVADLNGYDTVILTPNTGALTLTFFASSTASSWLPNAGDTQRTCFLNATGTAAATITFAAATGIDWETATSTDHVVGTPAKIGANELGCFIFVRQHSTATTFDITAAFMPFVNAD